MGSLLPSTRNTRALPTGTLRYIRSDFPENLTGQEIRWLTENRITTLVDLRSEEEAARKPCGLKEREGFRCFHFPVTGGGDTPKSLEHLHRVYRRMVDQQWSGGCRIYNGRKNKTPARKQEILHLTLRVRRGIISSYSSNPATIRNRE